MSKNTFKPDYTVAPGEILQEQMDHYGTTKTDLAAHLKIPKKKLKKILKGKAPIKLQMAIRLSRIYQYPAHMWVNLETNYRKDLKRLKK